MIDNPCGAFTCLSSTLTVWANSDPFRGLLLTVLLNPKVRLSVGHQRTQFGPILARFLDYYLVMGVLK